MITVSDRHLRYSCRI